MLGRNTEWRQGHLLTRESAAALVLVGLDDDAHRVIVVTHDCDLAYDGDLEHFIEVIVAAVSAAPDGNLSYAKNPRRLHLAFDSDQGGPLVLELQHVKRTAVPKHNFAQHAVRDNTVALSDSARRTLKQWLAARYGRPAFPNAFETRLRKSTGKRTVEQQIGKILEPGSSQLVGLFFDLGERRGTELPDGEPYALSISVVYDAVEGGTEARQAAEQAATDLRQLFDSAFGKPDVATEIALDACEAIADTHMTLADLRRVDQWRLEYISLRGNESGDFFPVGEIPA